MPSIFYSGLDRIVPTNIAHGSQKTLPANPDFFLETVPGDSLAESRAYLTRVDSWLVGWFRSWTRTRPDRPSRAVGGGRVLTVEGTAGASCDDPTTRAFVAGGDRLDGFPLTWEQMFHNSPRVDRARGTRDISKWLPWVEQEPLPAGCRVLPGPDGTARVFHPDGSMTTVYQPVPA